MSKNILEVRNLVKHFEVSKSVFSRNKKIVKAVDGISFDIKAGETLGLVGQSGCGKTTTARSLCLLDPKTSGTVNFNNPETTKMESIDEIDDDGIRVFRRNMQMIFQDPYESLNPRWTIKDIIKEPLDIHNIGSIAEREEAIIEILRTVGLTPPENYLKRYPHEISGGQKQRVVIAMALSCNPSILVADEPTTSLDVTVQKTIISLLKELQKEYNMGILFISHDLTLVAELADRVLVMFKGKIVEEGKVKEVYKNPQHPYTIGLLACKPPINIDLKELPTRKHFTEIDEDGFSVDVVRSVDDVLKNLSIKKSSIEFRNSILYDQEPLIDAKKLSKKYPLKSSKSKFFNAVENVSFKIFPGETLGLVGESGCGKSTLGKILLKLTEPSSGSILFNGENTEKNELLKILNSNSLTLQEGGRVSNLCDNVNKIKSMNKVIKILKKTEEKIKTITVGDNYNDLDMLKNSDVPCLVFNDQFKLDQINIDNLIFSNKPSPEGWADVIKKALAKLNYNV